MYGVHARRDDISAGYRFGIAVDEVKREAAKRQNGLAGIALVML